MIDENSSTWAKRLLLLILTLLVLAGCSKPSATPDAKSAGADKGEDKGSRILTIGMPTDMVSFDIHNHNTILTEAIHINMFNYLFKRNSDLEIKPDLVESYKVVDDTTWEFKLKKGVTFHNGDPFTSADVKYTLERVAKDKGLKENPNYKQIKEVKIIDDQNFQILTDGPQPALLNRLSRIGSGMLPKAYIEKNGFDYFLAHPIGTGPFKFSEWVRDDRVVLEAYDNYFEGRVKDWDRVVFRKIPEDSSRVNELLAGSVDLIANLPANLVNVVNAEPKTTMLKATSNRVGLLAVRSTKGLPTADPKVREAIDLAINKKALAETVLGGYATPTRTRVTPGNFGADPSLYNTSLYDPDKAKQLLKEAGYANGLTITLHSPNGVYTKDKEVSEMIQAMLGEVGIKVNLELMERAKFTEMRAAGKNKELFLASYGNSLFDADTALDVYRTEKAKTELDYSNREVDDLLKAALVNMNPKDRTAQYQRIQKIVAEERPHIYLYSEQGLYGVKKTINFKPRTDEMIYVPDITKK
ncbi:ABC transporter substrate-binding protein [Paenibacillus hamazuiensis]|uniref:ABC transporter substrate-binding protein n=1 Tax=Paenibacillus hamazuiensis TaxID=2936508 RepID=UPI00200D3F13|nr:ABC transporter substrate-binding protein [Paenibacillus hamazuiensis]